MVSSPSSQQAMRVLRHTFATHGLPDIIVSENGTAFTSAEFQFFAKAVIGRMRSTDSKKCPQTNDR